MPVPIVIENKSDKPTGAKIADYAGLAELGGYATQLFPSPWTRIGGGIAALFGGLGRTWGNYSAGRLPLGSAIIETGGDVAFPLVGIFAPQLGQARALKALQATKVSENATKGQQILNTAKNAAKATGRFGVNTGTNVAIAGAANYGLPGMIDSETLNPMYGVDYLKDDLKHVLDFDSPGARTRLFTTFGLPLLLPRLGKYNVIEDLKSPIKTQTTIESGPTRTTVNSLPKVTATTNGNPVTGPSSMSAAEAFESNSPAITALITAGGLGVASTAKGQNKPKSSKQQSKLRPQTSTGTLTGRALPLTRGLILGRKTGGKLEILKELRK